jgi:hypothetical protein
MKRNHQEHRNPPQPVQARYMPHSGRQLLRSLLLIMVPTRRVQTTKRSPRANTAKETSLSDFIYS